MKNKLFATALVVLIAVGFGFAQDIPQNQVASLAVNRFQQAFPKASDVEWKMDGENYKVEFEIGLLGTDHSAWYDKTGKLLKHKEEISKSALPKKVLDKIAADFKGFRISDTKKITEGSSVKYTAELKKARQEWKVMFDANGNILSKIAD